MGRLQTGLIVAILLIATHGVFSEAHKVVAKSSAELIQESLPLTDSVALLSRSVHGSRSLDSSEVASSPLLDYKHSLGGHSLKESFSTESSESTSYVPEADPYDMLFIGKNA